MRRHERELKPRVWEASRLAGGLLRAFLPVTEALNKARQAARQSSGQDRAAMAYRLSEPPCTPKEPSCLLADLVIVLYIATTMIYRLEERAGQGKAGRNA